jgi:hypothetical protein
MASQKETVAKIRAALDQLKTFIDVGISNSVLSLVLQRKGPSCLFEYFWVFQE